MTEKGMRLVAMIEEKENGQYDVVNFLPDLKIKHIQGKEFEVIEEKDHIQIPYAQGINDLTVIVGENGVGKTRLVNDIFSMDEKKMFVFENNSKVGENSDKNHNYYNFHVLYGSGQRSNEWKLSFDGVSLIKWIDERQYLSWLKMNVSVLKISHSIESSSSLGVGFDLSTSSQLHRHNIMSFISLSMANQIRFLLSNEFDFKSIEELLGLSGKKLILQFTEGFVGQMLKAGVKINDGKRYLEIVENYDTSHLKSLKDKIDFYITDYFAQIYYEYTLLTDRKLDYLGLLKNFDTIAIENKQSVKNFLNQKISEAKFQKRDVNDYIFETLKKDPVNEIQGDVTEALYKSLFYNYNPKQRIEILKKLVDYNSQEAIDKIDELFNYSGEKVDAVFDLRDRSISRLTSIIVKKEHNKTRYVLKKIELVNKLLSLQSEVRANEDYLVINGKGRWIASKFLRKFILSFNFKWQGLSSGQLAFLNLFGRLYSVSEKVRDQESILLLLDEVDLGLHPEWQRKWVSTALPIIGEIFKGKHVQIILTTHSPIMLSDIYGENVLMLRKESETGERQVVYSDEVPSTSFGQNIHQLFKESFFLEQTKGDYSLKVINATIKAVYDLNQERADEATIKTDFASELGVGDLSDGQFRAYLEKVIGAIGEKVIAQKLQDMYQTIPLWSQASSLEGKRAGDLSTEELRQLLRQREEAGQ